MSLFECASTSEKFWSEKTDAKYYTSKSFWAELPMFFMIHCQLELSTLVTELKSAQI